jgi:hypothetical protein
VIFILILVVVVAVLVGIVPAIATSVARNVQRNLDRPPFAGSIDQSIVEARLGRIEEAIDAMALQIERLSEHQQSLLGPVPDVSHEDEPSRTRTESPT